MGEAREQRLPVGRQRPFPKLRKLLHLLCALAVAHGRGQLHARGVFRHAHHALARIAACLQKAQLGKDGQRGGGAFDPGFARPRGQLFVGDAKLAAGFTMRFFAARHERAVEARHLVAARGERP